MMDAWAEAVQKSDGKIGIIEGVSIVEVKPPVPNRAQRRAMKRRKQL